MPFLISGAILVTILLALFAVCRWAYGKAFYHPNDQKNGDPRAFFSGDEHARYRQKLHELVDWLEPIDYERVSIRSRDGLTLVGRYYHTADKAPLKIVFHGWRSNLLRDCCGAAKMAMNAGYNLLLVHQRAHGESDGNTITFGVMEKYDCLDWVNYAVDRFGSDVKILLGGVSMGAATVLMASALPLPENVKGISGDCGYSSPEAIIRKVCREDMGIPDRLAFPFVRLAARLFGKFSLKDGGAAEAVKSARVPLMIMHGDADDFVPFSMCHEIYDNITVKKTIYTVEGAGHGLCYFADPEKYERALHEFEEMVLACENDQG